MKRVLLESAYVLHVRSYRETSQLVEIITPTHGRLTLVARGVRKSRSPLAGLLQPFVPLVISWSGKHELMSLQQVEARGQAKTLKGEGLFAGLYLNELLMYLLQKWDPHETLFQAYEQAITALQSPQLDPSILRAFEKVLLEELGYGVLPKAEADLHKMFEPTRYYRFVADQGFIACDPLATTAEALRTSAIFSGQNLIAIAKEAWEGEDVLQDARRLTRLVLLPLLGDKQIYSRQFFT